ncbi:uncharacterized protein LOC130848878 [Hippopotamus amphibius kiboko]|uniref:uncharacterized protein LOC130848878 n=1 Tax=Hippopotamus amphibius kiboko TaxID=575201 RepID=UPI002595EC45|nr:uncharacterized protein LOC130848878 [Hippopotamus amphibius kiboko]
MEGPPGGVEAGAPGRLSAGRPPGSAFPVDPHTPPEPLPLPDLTGPCSSETCFGSPGCRQTLGSPQWPPPPVGLAWTPPLESDRPADWTGCPVCGQGYGRSGTISPILALSRPPCDQGNSRVGRAHVARLRVASGQRPTGTWVPLTTAEEDELLEKDVLQLSRDDELLCGSPTRHRPPCAARRGGCGPRPPVAAVTSDRTRGGLKQQKSFFLSSGGQTPKVSVVWCRAGARVWAGPCSLPASGPPSVPASSGCRASGGPLACGPISIASAAVVTSPSTYRFLQTRDIYGPPR